MKWYCGFFAVTLLAQSGKLPGELAPFQKVTVIARVTGIVENVAVDRGSQVKQGQLLVELSAPEMKAQLAEVEAKALAIEAQRAEAEARRVAAESTLERLQTAASTPGAVAANDIVQARKQVDALQAVMAAIDKSAAAARAQARVLREMESYLKITAPFAGVITSRTAHPGMLASPAAGGLVELEQISRLRLVVGVPESELGKVVAGARWNFTVPAREGRVFTGVVARLARALDPKTRTMPVELDVVNGDGALAPGMYAEVSFPTGKTSK
jgi:RND family efflux transporter MFP subunit